MQVAQGIEMLEVAAQGPGPARVVHLTLARDERDAVLFDGGFPGQAPLILAALDESGAGPTELTRLLVTHQDVDHIGGIPEIRRAAGPQLMVMSSETEKPYIEGEKRLAKMTPERIEAAVAALPPEMRDERREAMRRVAENPPTTRVDETVGDGEVLPYCGGITAILVAGHTPGHTCYFHSASRTLIAGDALNIADGQLVGPAERMTPDMETATRSLGKLLAFNIEAVISYHGGLYRGGDVLERIAQIARG